MLSLLIYYESSNDTVIELIIYEDAFDNIIAFVQEIKYRFIFVNEYDDMTMLAESFLSEELLILLLKFSNNHSWIKSIDTVILKCLSLALLREEVLTDLNKAQSLTKDVFIMNKWLFLSKKHHTKLQMNNVKILNLLILHVICVKKSDVILCMSKVKNLMSHVNT